MKTYKELSGELDEIMSFKARKALGRRLRQMAKKASTKFKKARNKLKKLPKIMSVQNAYSLLCRTYEIGLAEISIRENCGLLSYSCLLYTSPSPRD